MYLFLFGKIFILVAQFIAKCYRVVNQNIGLFLTDLFLGSSNRYANPPSFL